MHALVITNATPDRSADADLRVEELPDPVPGDTEVLVRVHAAGLNGADLLQLKGHYPGPAGALANVPGLEVAGEVVAAGSKVTGARPGDRVMALVAGAGQATMAAIDESHLLPLPKSMSWPEAGGFPEVFSTAYDALFTRCGLGVGDRLLVTGASGGVGVAALQLGAAAGARIVAAVRDPADAQRKERLVQLGAHEVVGTDGIAPGGPYDVVLELVGRACLPQALSALATGARVAVIGVGSGSHVDLDLLTLMRSRATIGGSTLRARSRAEKAAVAAAVRAHVLPLVDSGKVQVPVDATFPLAEGTSAYERFAAGGKLGKIVLLPDSR